MDGCLLYIVCDTCQLSLSIICKRKDRGGRASERANVEDTVLSISFACCCLDREELGQCSKGAPACWVWCVCAWEREERESLCMDECV